MSKTNKEIELKLDISPDVLERVKKSASYEGFTAGRASTKTLQSIYFDTPDQALRDAKISLRVRKIGRSWVQTAKVGTGMNGPLSSPIEAEHPVKGAQLDFSVIEDPEVVEVLTRAIADKPLAPCFETVLKRTTRILTAKSDGTQIEVAFDSGEVKAGQRSTPLAEIELELKSGTTAPLFVAAREIIGQEPFRFSNYSKAERGFRFAGGEVDDVKLPKLAQEVGLFADETVELAYREILRSCLSQIAHNRIVMLESGDPEGPHQLRVGLRRLRSAFRMFKPVLNPVSLEKLDKTAQSLAGEAGELRDLDVLTEEIVAPLSQHAPPGLKLDALLDHMNVVREDCRAALQTHMAAPDINGFLFDLAAYTETRGWLDPENFDQTALLAQSVRNFSKVALHRRWKKAAKYGARIDDLTIPERHDMRKALKKLRYGVEFFGSLYPASEIKPFLKRMKKLQDVFGYLNDVAMAEKLLVLPAPKKTSGTGIHQAVGFVIGWHEAQAHAMWSHAKEYWKDTKKTKRFWE
ncbi:inorganic triphosphatase YgiF [Roseibium hamelinense]|uniref:Inorganic triphosphatase YgiF n=1 Tax=Roseibium hamelinense TaxID=150831 RepID=A0A562SMK0_9HYPH|nr:CYTH and CHAD domain-containing protein [Roseibium hamelinense]MTI43455.1 CYTH and CHAD domain-containing protein [Roseibium hamelinense]TWI81916.1 inorganic triphosphatase YgiF [Roseibium hamelinense]